MSDKDSIMTDYFKSRIHNPSICIKELEYCVKINSKTNKPIVKEYEDEKGRYKTRTVDYQYEFKGLTFQRSEVEKTYLNGDKFYSERYVLEGSLHKYKNEGYHNYNRFSFWELVEAIKTLCIDFNLNPEELEVYYLEFGLNVILPIDSLTYLNAIKSYKRKTYSLESYHNGGKMLQFTLSQNHIKCYDKGRQFRNRYNTPENLFRIENRATKGDYTKRLGIATLADLTVKENISRLGVELLKIHEQLILFNGSKKGKTTKRKEMIANMNNRDFWKDLSDEKFKRYKTYLTDPDFNTLNTLSEEVYQLLKEEINQVMKQPKKHPRFDHLNKKENTPKLNTSIEGQFKGKTENKCLISGKDISDQKKGSKFLSAKKVGIKIAHDLRNADSNPRNNLKRRILKPIANSQTSMFGVFENLQLNQEQEYIAGSINFDS